MSGIKRSPDTEEYSRSKRSKLLNKNNGNPPEMSSHLVGTSKNGLNSKLTKPLAKPAPSAINHTKPTTKKLVIKNLKGMLLVLRITFFCAGGTFIRCRHSK